MMSAQQSDRADEGTPIPLPQTKLMSQRTLTWTSTKTPATSVGEALQNQVTGFERLEQQGIQVTKVTSRGAFKTRVLTVSQDKFALFCTHRPLKGGGKGVLSTVATKLPVPFVTRKGVRGFTSDASLRDRFVRYIDVADIDAVVVGVVGTQKLEYARNKNRLKGLDSLVDVKREQLVIIVHHGNETLNVLVPNEDDRKELVECLGRMRSTYDKAKTNVSNDALLLRYIWYDVDVNRDGKIGEKEFAKILYRINFYVSNPKKLYQEFNQEKGRKKGELLTYADVTSLLQKQKNTSKSKSMANQIWDGIFGPNLDAVGDTEFLTKFLHGAQGETRMTIDDVRQLFTVLNAMEVNHSEGEPQNLDPVTQISRARFEVYLYHEMNDAYDPSALGMDGVTALDKPLSRYWICTSHNTYLTGDQLASFSSVEMYMKALYRGCKCLELDCWDGEKTPGGEPIPVVFHGHTLTSKITFADIIAVVQNYMDQNPETYPVILSLENHCSHPYQKMMAIIMQETLGSLLYVPTEKDKEGDLPSPESMRGRVIIKGKRPPEADDADDAEPGQVRYDDTDQYSSFDDQAPAASTTTKKDDAVKMPKIVPELARLTLLHGTKFKDFETSVKEPRSHMHSVGEAKIGKILNKSSSNTPLWKYYNVHHMTRTYPAGSRVDSSNYNPILAWSVGCQLVALNFQTTDSPLILNDGLFRQNGRCGYLLKPAVVLGNKPQEEHEKKPAQSVEKEKTTETEQDFLDEVMNSFEEVACCEGGSTAKILERKQEVIQEHKEQLERKEEKRKEEGPPVRLKVRILSGSCLPKPRGAKSGENIDPYVTVSVHDVKRGKDAKATYDSQSYYTNAVSDNGFCPVWNEKESQEFMVYSPNVAMIQFSLNESDIGIDDKVADAAIPVCHLRKGYRSIQLYDRNDTRTGPFGFATVLVEIQIFESPE